VELMDAGWNFRREHPRLATRIHYVISNGGDQPNVVPPNAAVWQQRVHGSSFPVTRFTSSPPTHAPARAALYLRVSTRADKREDPDVRQRERQEMDNQRRQVRQLCETHGWEIVAEYIDEESGSKSDRVGFQHMWRGAAQRQFDVLLFWALDRFSREGVPKPPTTFNA
jgi:hypothetical protein